MLKVLAHDFTLTVAADARRPSNPFSAMRTRLVIPDLKPAGQREQATNDGYRDPRHEDEQNEQLK